MGQRLGICYYCWDRGTDLRQGICRECRAADSIGIELDDAELSPPRNAALSYGFIHPETIRDLLGFLPEKITRDLDAWDMRQLPGDCVDSHLRVIYVDAVWGLEYLPGRRQRSGMAVLMIEVLAHPYPGVVRRLRRYASMLSGSLRRSRSVGERPPSIVPVLIYNGAPAWTPQSCTEEFVHGGFVHRGTERVRVHVHRRGSDAARRGEVTRTRRGLVESHDRHRQDPGLLVIAVAMAAALQDPSDCAAWLPAEQTLAEVGRTEAGAQVAGVEDVRQIVVYADRGIHCSPRRGTGSAGRNSRTRYGARCREVRS